MTAAPQPSELQIQASFRKRLYYGAPAVSVVAIPNAGKRGLGAQRQAKKEGLSSGFPDVLCLAPGKIAFVEFKSAKGTVSDNQSEWHERLARFGFPVTVARSADEAVDFLREHGFPIMEQPA